MLKECSMKLNIKYLLFTFCLLATQPACAYLDPSTASVVLQGLIGGVAAGVGFFSLYYTKTKQFFNKLRKPKK